MSKSIFDISDGAWEQDIQAVKVFTDREDPQEAFERKFRVLSKNWRKTFYVMCYYGIGGIGKTSFVNKLCRVIKNIPGNDCRLLDKIDCNYIHYDFDAKNAGSDKYSILVSWRKMIMETDPHFKFFRFDSAILLYAKKTGSTIEKDETAQSVLENNPWLNVLVTGIGALPVIGWISNATQAFDQATNATISAISNQFDKKRYQAHLTEIESMEPPEIIDKLHEYFILDMRDNMQYRAKKPLVIFLDTYEKYIDTVNREINMITEDRWLRKGRRSVIQSIPGILWVITGRERLYWAQDDCIWESEMPERPLDQMTEAEKEDLAHELLEQHLLGDLSFKDASYFLQQANVTDNTLYEPLYQLTNGTPLFLDICVDNYHDLITKGYTPTIDDFGTDLTELISRYLSNMQNEAREMAYFLACLGTWTDEFVNLVASKSTLLKNYTHARYMDFSKLSFIIQNPDGSFYMHETVATAALENADEEFIKEISSIKLSILSERLSNTDILTFNTTISNYVNTLISVPFTYNEYLSCIEIINSNFQPLMQNGSYDLMYTLSKKLYLSAHEKHPQTDAELLATINYAHSLLIKGIYGEAKNLISNLSLKNNQFQSNKSIWSDILHKIGKIYTLLGQYQKAEEYLLLALEERIKLLGEDHPDTLSIMLTLSVSYTYLDKYEQALALSKQTLDARIRVLGENHPDTLTAASNLAVIYSRLNNKYDFAIELCEYVLEARTKLLGAEHPDTLRTMNNLANIYSLLGNHEAALELICHVRDTRIKILGEMHPDTLGSLNNLANIYTRLGKHDLALELSQQVLDGRTKILGEEHPRTLEAMTNLAMTYSNIGEYDTALELKKQVIKVNTQLHGEEHPNTLKALHSLVYTYELLGQYKTACELSLQVFEARVQILGEDHPDTISIFKLYSYLAAKQ